MTKTWHRTYITKPRRVVKGSKPDKPKKSAKKEPKE
jgi:cbb3-type cytochrome oxidase cytochrome c subunit